MAERPIPLILDTDIGDDIDDLYALYLAVFHPRLDLRAVTTSHRSCLRKARFVEKALRVAGREDLPVGAGIDLSVARKALGQMNPDPGEMGTHLQWVTEVDPERANTYEYGPDLILAALDAAAEPVAIACIGACSNVAEALNRATPEQYEKIRCIALMSGEPELSLIHI